MADTPRITAARHVLGGRFEESASSSYTAVEQAVNIYGGERSDLKIEAQTRFIRSQKSKLQIDVVQWAKQRIEGQLNAKLYRWRNLFNRWRRDIIGSRTALHKHNSISIGRKAAIIRLTTSPSITLPHTTNL